MSLAEELKPEGRFFPWAILASLALFQLLCVPGHYIGFEHDDIQYVLAARSLLEGHYSLGIIPGDPPLTVASPGWPLLLMPAALVSGDNPLGYQLWAWLWLVVCDVLLWRWLRRQFSPAMAAAGTALFALNPLILSRAGVLMNEIPYLAFVLGGFVLFDREKPVPGWAAGLLVGFTWLIRTASLPLAAAVFALLAARRRWKDLATAMSIWGVAVVGWKVWSDWGGTGLAEHAELIETFGVAGLGSVGSIIAGNVMNAFKLLGETLLPWRPYPGTPMLATVCGGVVWVAAIAGLIRRYRDQGLDLATAYLGFGLLLHAVWPWWYQRYLPPYLPVLILGWLFLLAQLPKSTGLLAASLLALVSVPGQGTVLIRREYLRYRPEMAQTYASIREHSAPDALFTSAFYCRDAYYAGRPFVPFPGGEGTLAQRMRALGIRFVLWNGVPDLGSSLGDGFEAVRKLKIMERELEGPDFHIFYKNSQENVTIYSVAK
ncbi:MAG: hypothetical protein COB53_03380 [Elusimicrobia bacterium]|nr:MAG: hypothetical protein COB53_03380 [Elusimicrobiota bacterium]